VCVNRSRRSRPRFVSVFHERKKKHEGGREEDRSRRARGSDRAESGPGVDPVAYRTPGRSDVRSALTCWIRRECDAKVSRSVKQLRPGSTSGRGEGARRDGRRCPLRFRGPVATNTGREGDSLPVGFPVPRRDKSPCHAFSVGSATGSRHSLCHPLCRHYCHRHCTLASVILRSSPLVSLELLRVPRSAS